MKDIAKPISGNTRSLLILLVLLTLTIAARAQVTPGFSGLWQQDNDRCQPKRSGSVTLHIVQSGTAFTVETSLSYGSQSSRHALQKYTTDGKISVSTGADGDEFHTSVVWQGASLVFSIEEHEENRILQSQETWSLLDDGATLKKVRESPNGKTQILFFRRSR